MPRSCLISSDLLIRGFDQCLVCLGNCFHATFIMTLTLPDLTVRSMMEEDLDRVVAIERQSFPHPWTVDHFRDELHVPHAFPLVAEFASVGIAGYLCPMQLLDEGEILNMAVREECRGFGVGRLLLTTALRRFREQGASRVFLEVRVTNQAAVSLYRAFDFRTVGRRKGYYENGEDAFLMEFIINGADHAV